MTNKLIPAHVLFTKWFIRIRWIALGILVISTYVVKNLLHIPIQDVHIYFLALVLLLLNISHLFILRRITAGKERKMLSRIKWGIHFQIISDLIVLTLILHFSGGIENPLILFYFFHMIIASSIFSTLGSYLHASFALLLVASLTFLEFSGHIPHYHLEGFVDHDLYKNKTFLTGAAALYIFTSYILVSLSHMIISRSIKSEEAYVKTNIELETVDKLRNEYVLRVTHDIKGHLAAILSCLEVIRSQIVGPLNNTQKEFTTRAYERTELLSRFVKDLLNLTKRRLQRDYDFEMFSLHDLIHRIISPIQVLAKDKSIDFNFFVDKGVHQIKGNPFMIEELFSNLLLNAIKYTPPQGHVLLIVRNRHDHIIAEVSDSGIGIPKEDQSKIFDEFYRASNVPKDVKTGSGLGLSIAKQIVESHKGRIWVSSEPGAWTKFTFTLPKNPTIIP